MAILKGKIDLHVHGAPDIIERKSTELDIAQKVKKNGMEGVLFKAHSRITSSSVNEINKRLGKEIAYSSLVLNDFCGGFNVNLVREEIKKGVKVIFMPTLSSLHQRRFEGVKEGLTIFEKGRIKKKVIEILHLIAKNNLALATGHLSRDEVIALVKEANEIGIEKIIITHPDLKLTLLSVATQRELLKYDIILERTFYASINPNFPQEENPEDLITESGQAYSRNKLKEVIWSIRSTGVENNLLTSDLGQVPNLEPAEGFRFYLTKLRQDFSNEEIDIMAKINPAKILGLREA